MTVDARLCVVRDEHGDGRHGFDGQTRHGILARAVDARIAVVVGRRLNIQNLDQGQTL